MTSRRPASARAPSRAARATVAFVAIHAFHAGRAVAAPEAAPQTATQTEIEVARRTFASAYEDELAGRFASALTKLREVRAVRDTASVRYRIASCLEALGKLRDAREVFLSVGDVPLGPTEDHAVTTSAMDHARALEGKLARLFLRVDGAAKEQARLEVDGVHTQLTAGSTLLVLDPGDHTVRLSAPGRGPQAIQITLIEGKESSLALSLVDPPPPPVAHPRYGNTVGIVTTTTGIALVAGAVIALVVRETAISRIAELCPAGTCPRSAQPEVEGASARATAAGPVAAVLGAAGGISLGVGLYLVLRPVAAPTGAGAALGVGGTLP